MQEKKNFEAKQNKMIVFIKIKGIKQKVKKQKLFLGKSFII